MATRTPGAIPDALRNFDSLPDAALIPDKIVAAVLGCSIPSVWRMSKDGRIPAPVRPSDRMTRWVVGGIRNALTRCEQFEAQSTK